jgi:hypothetical protein
MSSCWKPSRVLELGSTVGVAAGSNVLVQA